MKKTVQAIKGTKMMKSTALIAGLLCLTLIVAGCAGPRRVEMDYGTSYNNAKLSQALNPEAEKNLEPVYGLDGPAAEIVIGKYREGFARGQAGSQGAGSAAGAWGTPAATSITTQPTR